MENCCEVLTEANRELLLPAKTYTFVFLCLFCQESATKILKSLSDSLDVKADISRILLEETATLVLLYYSNGG